MRSPEPTMTVMATTLTQWVIRTITLCRFTVFSTAIDREYAWRWAGVPLFCETIPSSLSQQIMPTYEYRCPDGHDFERFLKMSEATDILACPVCGKPATRKISGGAGLV